MSRALMIILFAGAFVCLIAAAFWGGNPILRSWQIDQASLCLFANDQQAANCKDGELAYYKPESARSGQAILNVAAAYCDIRYQVLQNEGGVLCVFTDERRHLMQPQPQSN